LSSEIFVCWKYYKTLKWLKLEYTWLFNAFQNSRHVRLQEINFFLNISFLSSMTLIYFYVSVCYSTLDAFSARKLSARFWLGLKIGVLWPARFYSVYIIITTSPGLENKLKTPKSVSVADSVTFNHRVSKVFYFKKLNDSILVMPQYFA